MTVDNPDPDSNRAVGYAGFLRRWQNQQEAGNRELAFAAGAGGNINFTGRDDCSSSHMLTRWHPSFLASIEPGVRDLVQRLVERWDCVTYSSCEGHHSTSAEPMRPRNVRLGSRSALEHTTLIMRFDALCRGVSPTPGNGAVALQCRESSLHLGDGLEAPSLDLVFARASGDEAAYWLEIDVVYQATLISIDDL